MEFSQKCAPIDRLELMLDDMEAAPAIYRPTNFWQSGLKTIIDDLKTSGFATFRDHPSAKLFYVPTFCDERLAPFARPVIGALRLGSAVNRIKRLAIILQEEIDGTANATRLHQILTASLPPEPHAWGTVSESDVGAGERFNLGGRSVSKSLLNYQLGLSFLDRITKSGPWGTALEIGGGYGTLGEILLKADDGAFYVNVDIPPVAAVSSYYLEEVFGAENVLTYEQSRDLDEIDIEALKGQFRAVVLCPWQIERLKGSFDLFVNFISFQEMEPEVVQNYISVVRGLNPASVLLRNSVRGKTQVKKTGKVGVMEPTTTDQMIDWFEDYALAGRDSEIFGATSRDGGFASEVVVLRQSE